MATKMLNIQDYAGYIKCGEILKSPLPTYQDPFILKCNQCDKINFVLESFIIHIQAHCIEAETLNENIDIKIANEAEIEKEPNENPVIKIETITMDVDDPLIVIKDEIVEHNLANETENYTYPKEDTEDIEEYSSNTDDNYHSEDADTENEECNLNKDKKSMLNPSNFCITNIQEGQDSNFIKPNDINLLRNEFKKDLQRTERFISKEIKMQTEIIKTYLMQFLEDTKVVPNQNIPPVKNKIIPMEPFSSIENFLKLEEDIKNDEEKYNQLISELERQTGSSVSSYVKSIWRKLVTDGAAQHMCWKGTERKTPVRSLTITQALKAVSIRKFFQQNDLEFEKISILHFQQAKGRHQKKA